MDTTRKLPASILLIAALAVLGLGLAHDLGEHVDHEHCDWCLTVVHGAPLPHGPFLVPQESEAPLLAARTAPHVSRDAHPSRLTRGPPPVSS